MSKQKHNKRHSFISFHHTVVLKTVAKQNIMPYHTTMVLNKQLFTKKQKRKKQLFIFPWIGSDPRWRPAQLIIHRSIWWTCKNRGKERTDQFVNLWSILLGKTWWKYLRRNCMPKPPFKIRVLTQTIFPCQFCRAELSSFCWAFFERMQICFPRLSPFLGRSSQLDCFCSYLKLIQTGD